MEDGYFATFEAALGDIATIGNALGKATQHIHVPTNDPKAVAIRLFARSWSHFNAFTALYKAVSILEAEIILRGSIEVAICMANLERRGKDFVADLGEDFSKTIDGQLNMMRKAGYSFAEKLAKDWADEIAVKGKRLDLEKLAEQANVSDLYAYHRALSGMAVHITGVSILRHNPLDDGDDKTRQLTDEVAEADRRRVVYWMVPTMTATMVAYAAIIDSSDGLEQTGALLLKLKPALEKYAAAKGVELPTTN